MGLFDFFKSRKVKQENSVLPLTDKEKNSFSGVSGTPLNAKYTPENITTLGNREIFVFGSNLAGHHSGGAAKVAELTEYISKLINIIELYKKSYQLPIYLGDQYNGKPLVSKLSNFLIIGTPDNPNTIITRSIISSLLIDKTPSELQLLFLLGNSDHLCDFNLFDDYLLEMPNPNLCDKNVSLAYVDNLKRLLMEVERRFESFGSLKNYGYNAPRSFSEYNDIIKSNPSLLNEGHIEYPYLIIVIEDLQNLVFKEEIGRYLFKLISKRCDFVGIYVILHVADFISNTIGNNLEWYFTNVCYYKMEVVKQLLRNKGIVENLSFINESVPVESSIIKVLPLLCTDNDIEMLNIFTKKRISIQTKYSVTNKVYKDLEFSDPLVDRLCEDIKKGKEVSVHEIMRKYNIGYCRANKIINQIKSKNK